MELKLSGERAIRTYSGKSFDVFDPNPDDICIEDIAHALSMTCRFGGHTNRFYSVAEHSILVAQKVPDEDKLAALLHDATEAYMVDMPRPIKYQLPDFIKLEDELMVHIAKKFDFPFPFPKSVKIADDELVRWEWDCLVTRDQMDTMTPEVAKEAFLATFYNLKNVPSTLYE